MTELEEITKEEADRRDSFNAGLIVTTGAGYGIFPPPPLEKTISKEAADKKFAAETTFLAFDSVLLGAIATFTGSSTVYSIAENPDIFSSNTAVLGTATIALALGTAAIIRQIYRDVRDYLNNPPQYVQEVFHQELIE